MILFLFILSYLSSFHFVDFMVYYTPLLYSTQFNSLLHYSVQLSSIQSKITFFLNRNERTFLENRNTRIFLDDDTDADDNDTVHTYLMSG